MVLAKRNADQIVTHKYAVDVRDQVRRIPPSQRFHVLRMCSEFPSLSDCAVRRDTAQLGLPQQILSIHSGNTFPAVG
jgi:hypothetical protein